MRLDCGDIVKKLGSELVLGIKMRCESSDDYSFNHTVDYLGKYIFKVDHIPEEQVENVQSAISKAFPAAIEKLKDKFIRQEISDVKQIQALRLLAMQEQIFIAC